MLNTQHSMLISIPHRITTPLTAEVQHAARRTQHAKRRTRATQLGFAHGRQGGRACQTVETQRSAVAVGLVVRPASRADVARMSRW